jgi:hypothetical protein
MMIQLEYDLPRLYSIVEKIIMEWRCDPYFFTADIALAFSDGGNL